MSLGDVSLFLGNNPPVSVAASDFPGCQTSHDVDDSAEHAGVVVWGCQSNSIYFSDCLRDSDSNTKYGRVNVEMSNKDLIVGVLKCYLLCILVVNIRACLVCISCMSRVYLVHIHVYLVHIRSYSSHFVLRFKCIKVKVI